MARGLEVQEKSDVKSGAVRRNGGHGGHFNTLVRRESGDLVGGVYDVSRYGCSCYKNFYLQLLVIFTICCNRTNFSASLNTSLTKSNLVPMAFSLAWERGCNES